MRILHVAPITAERPTGPGHSVPLQMLAEQRHGHQVALLQTWRGQAPALPPGAIHVSWPVSWLPLSPVPFPLRAVLARAGFWPDLVHFHSVYLPRHAGIAAAVRRYGIPTVNSPRGGLLPAALARRAWKKRLGDALFFDRFCRGLALNRALNGCERDACVARYPAIPVCVAGNPIDLDAMPLLLPPHPARGTLALGFLGRLDVHTKGLDLLLEGLRRAHDAGLPSGVHLRIAGPDHRGGAGAVRRLVHALGLEARVRVHPPCTGDAKLAYLEGIDVFVHPSRHEALPMGVLEALAVGRPVVVSPETNLGELVVRHRAGWVTDARAGTIARTLLDLATAPDSIVERSRAGRQLVRLEFSLDAVGAQLTQAYRNVLARTAPRRAA